MFIPHLMTAPRTPFSMTRTSRSGMPLALLLVALGIALYLAGPLREKSSAGPQRHDHGTAVGSNSFSPAPDDLGAAADNAQPLNASLHTTAAAMPTARPLDPLATLSAALDLPPGAEREQALLVALSLWATTDLEAAGKWAASQRLVDATWGLDAVLQGARENQEAGKRLIVQLTQLHPERAEDFGAQWIRALGSFGAHQTAATFATTATGNSERLWMSLAFAQWAQVDPEAAVLAATELEVPDQRRSAFETVAAVWAKTNPRDLARFALRLPAGPERNLSMVSALRSWSAVDANAAANWIQANKDQLTNIPRLELILED